MRKNLFTLLFITFFTCLLFSQYGESITDMKKFTTSEKKFNDWAVSFYTGMPFIINGDLTSIKHRGVSFDGTQTGYDFQLGLSKSITHAFGFQLLGSMGRTNQGIENIKAKTEYQSLALLADLNLTSLLRRVDNKSPYRWSLHAYGGGGIIGYDTYQSRNDAGYKLVTNQPFNQSSFYTTTGLGLKYKISRRFDAELRAMYLMSGDDEFDGGGESGVLTLENLSDKKIRIEGINSETDALPDGRIINSLEESVSDNLVSISLGVSYKFGKHKEHLQWFDPMHDLYPPGNQSKNDKTDSVGIGCTSGDADQDGVCDDWDKELDTPAGARVDGSGVALDTDLDGIIDLFDKCPTYPSSNKENGGCPTLQELIDTINGDNIKANSSKDKEGVNLPPIEFEFNSDKITGSSIPTVDNIVNVLRQFYKNESILVEGHTDAVGSANYNNSLSERRVKSVIKYIGDKGINTANFTAVGKGFSELKYPECNPASKCPEFKNKENRRVIFKMTK